MTRRMWLSGSSRRRGAGGWVRLVIAMVLVTLPLASIAPASAAGGALNVSMTAIDTAVKSGEGASFRVQWSCSGSGAGGAAGTCDNATITVPVPTGAASSTAFPSGIPLTVTSQSSLQVNGVTLVGSTSKLVGTAPNQSMVWTFPATVATGTTGTVTFTLLAPNSVTPDGTTITPEATFTATGLEPGVKSSAKSTVNSQVSLKVAKNKAVPTDVPYVNQQVTYNIRVGYEAQFPTNGQTNYAQRMDDICKTVGTQALQNLVVVDTLPAGAQFIQANFGGTYNPTTNQITWNLGSSISNTTPFNCKAFVAGNEWLGQPLTATLVYPDTAFNAQSPDVVNSVTATANPWGQSTVLTDDDSTKHALRVGSAGASVVKLNGYDWAVGDPTFRNQDSKSDSSLFAINANSKSSTEGTWTLVDMLPCALQSPTNVSDVSCATPAYTDIRFSSTGQFPELKIKWTTNSGLEGICTIAAGNVASDTTRRWCNGGIAATSLTGVPADEWITKFELTTKVPPFGGGYIYIHGRVEDGIPTSNVGTTYNLTPKPTLSDVHPWFVTVENCTAVNKLDFGNGTVYVPRASQAPSDNGGRCGYRQVMTNPAALRAVKSMYDPEIPEGSRPASPSVQTGDKLRVDLQIRRDSWQSVASVLNRATFTPTVTEYLPASLVFDPASLVVVGDATLKAALGSPTVTSSLVTYRGEQRTKIVVTFPNANITASATLGRTATIRFDVTVADGTAAARYTNAYLLEAAEAGPGIGETYLVCPVGTMVDADLVVTTDRNKAVGCLAEASYTVLPVPGISTSKTVKGVYDKTPMTAPGVGRTDLTGDAEYAITAANTGSVNVSGVVLYDILPRIGDTDILPGSNNPRGSQFPVKLTGAVTAPAGSVVQYSTSVNPCRGELAGSGGGATASAPIGCSNDWLSSPPAGDYAAVTALRVDFGSTVFAAGDKKVITVDVSAAGPNVTSTANLDGVAWNNTAVFGREASSNAALLPTEASKVGLRLLPDLAWRKTDKADGSLLGGSVWSLAPAAGAAVTVADCNAAPCTGVDTDPVAGQFLLTGLAWGEYTLTETTAPGGYQLLTEPVAVHLTAGTVDRVTYTLDLGAQENTAIEGDWSWSKASDPVTGTAVKAGQVVTYTITARNDTNHPVTQASLTDDLTDVLDDASFGSITLDDAGRATRAGNILTWKVGTLPANTVRTVIYMVSVNADGERGDNILKNVLAKTGVTDPVCGDTGVSCTEHPVPELTWWKGVASDESPVAAGTVLTYTLSFRNTGAAPAQVDKVDDLTQVTDDAAVTTEPTSADGLTAVRTANRIVITGQVPAGKTYTVTYQVTVKADADRGDSIAANFLLSPDDAPPTEPVCQPTNVQKPDCTVTPVGMLLTGKSVSASTTPVVAGTVLTYTLTFDNQGKAPVKVDRTDLLADVLDDASMTRDPKSSDAALVVSPVVDTSFSTAGTLAPGQKVAVTYQVTVKADKDRGNSTADNFLVKTLTQPPATCVEANRNCTQTPIEAPEDPVPTTSDVAEPGGWLPNTGGPAFWTLLVGMAGVVGGVAVVRRSRVRAR